MNQRLLHSHISLPWIGVNLLRLLLSATFIFSGLVKIIDPLGVSYKVHDYLTAMNLTVSDQSLLPLLVAVALCITEFTLGLYLLFGIRRRWTTRLLVTFLLVMTGLTMWLALTDAVDDCGCFGDAVILTNWQTFGKNLILFACACVVCWQRKYLTRFISESMQWLISLYSLAFAIFICGLCLYYLPIIDFRPFHIGQHIPTAMTWPEDPEAQPEIVDFDIEPIEGEALPYTEDELPMDQLLADTSYTFLLAAPYLDRADDGTMDQLNGIYDYCLEHGYRFIALTASSSESIARWRDLTGAEYPFAFTDELTLKTMVRSNPGLLLLHDGTIVGKWPSTALPRTESLTAPLHALPLAHPQEKRHRDMLLRLLWWYLVPLLTLTLLDRAYAAMKWWLRRRKNPPKLAESESLVTFAPTNKEQDIKIYHTMRKKIVAGNWKMNLNLQEGVALATELKEALAADQPNCDVVICTPFIHLAKVADVVEGTVIGLGAENCADKEKGAYTGEVSAAQVKSTGAQYVILGHSERRQYYHETAEILKEKVNLALANGLKVIFCIGEVLEEREAGKQNEVVGAQLADSLFDLTEEQLKDIILAYEPVWAIGTGKTATAEQAEDMHAFIRGIIAGRFGEQAAEDISILYGGSCKPSNAKEIFSKPDVDGGLIGGAALKCADFKGIIDAWK